MLADWLESIRTQARAQAEAVKQNSDSKYPSPSVVTLAENLKAWHDNRPIPDRWAPVALGRLAAYFGATRELMAAACRHAGWLEKRESGRSLWTPIRYEGYR